MPSLAKVLPTIDRSLGCQDGHSLMTGTSSSHGEMATALPGKDLLPRPPSQMLVIKKAILDHQYLFLLPLTMVCPTDSIYAFPRITLSSLDIAKDRVTAVGST